MDKYERSIRREGIEQGIKQGLKQGIEQGIEQTTELVNKLLKQNRIDDIRKLTAEPGYREQLFREFGL